MIHPVHRTEREKKWFFFFLFFDSTLIKIKNKNDGWNFLSKKIYKEKVSSWPHIFWCDCRGWGHWVEVYSTPLYLLVFIFFYCAVIDFFFPMFLFNCQLLNILLFSFSNLELFYFFFFLNASIFYNLLNCQVIFFLSNFFFFWIVFAMWLESNTHKDEFYQYFHISMDSTSTFLLYH